MKKKPTRSSPAIDAAEIRQFMAEHMLDDLVIETDDNKIEVRSGNPGFYAPVSPRSVPSDPAPSVSPAPSAAPAASPYIQIRAPMAGTFYRASSPGSDPYAKEGDKVNPNTTVCVIEAMKVMNEIKADASGKIVKICLENAASIEQGAVMFEIDPAG